MAMIIMKFQQRDGGDDARIILYESDVCLFAIKNTHTHSLQNHIKIRAAYAHAFVSSISRHLTL